MFKEVDDESERYCHDNEMKKATRFRISICFTGGSTNTNCICIVSR